MNQDIEQYRPGFEAWARIEEFDLTRTEGGAYADNETQSAWDAVCWSKREASTEPSSIRNAAFDEAIAAVPGGSMCDPQHISDAIRELKVHATQKDETNARYTVYVEKCRAGGILPCSLESFREDEAKDAALDAQCWQYIEEHATTHGGGHGFTITCFVPCDHEDMRCGILAAIEAQASAQDEK